MADAATATKDGLALAQLEKGGSDLSSLHEFNARVERGKSEAEWMVHAIKRLYPVESDLIGLRDKLDDIARQLKGTYVGWTAKVAEYKKG
jgi:Regulator of ribonuclease activity B